MHQRNSIIFSCLLLFLTCLCASAQSIEAQRQRRSRLEKDISILQKQLSVSSSKSEQAISSLTLIQAQRASRQKLVRESDRQISVYNAKIQALQYEIRRHQTVLDTLQSHYSRLVMGAYKNRDIKIWYMYILASDNVSQAFRRFGYFKSLASQIDNQARKIEQMQATLTEKKSELLSLRGQAQDVRKARAADLKLLKNEEAQQQKLVSSLKKDTKAFRKALQSKKDEIKAIDRKIEQMLRQAQNGAGGKMKNSEVDYVLDQSFEKNKGKLPWPVEGPVAEHFGPYQNRELKLSLFNNGINIACESGEKIHSVFDGVVSNIMIAPGYGQCILIQHGSYYTSYCKVKNAYVHQGDKVKTGQEIGEVATVMGKTQLYFLVFKKKYLDPEQWLRERQ